MLTNRQMHRLDLLKFTKPIEYYLKIEVGYYTILFAQKLNLTPPRASMMGTARQALQAEMAEVNILQTGQVMGERTLDKRKRI